MAASASGSQTHWRKMCRANLRRSARCRALLNPIGHGDPSPGIDARGVQSGQAPDGLERLWSNHGRGVRQKADDDVAARQQAADRHAGESYAACRLVRFVVDCHRKLLCPAATSRATRRSASSSFAGRRRRSIVGGSRSPQTAGTGFKNRCTCSTALKTARSDNCSTA